MLVRLVTPFGEAPRIRIRLRPGFARGRTRPTITRGSNHIRYVDDTVSLRLTTNAPLTCVLDETAFCLEGPLGLILGRDESLKSGVVETARHFLDETAEYWRGLVRHRHLPFDWQEAVIRSAITPELCSFEETGAVIAAPTSSLPEAEGEGRNWDYRYCWLRDAFFVVRALNRLGYVETMEGYIDCLANIVANSRDGYLQPVYGIGLEARLAEREVTWLAGFRGNRPIRVGNQAHEHDRHDGYGSVVLAATQAFFDRRLRRPAGPRARDARAPRREGVGVPREAGCRPLGIPHPGARAHPFERHVLAACDRLARIAAHLGLPERARHRTARAAAIRSVIEARPGTPKSSPSSPVSTARTSTRVSCCCRRSASPRPVIRASAPRGRRSSASSPMAPSSTATPARTISAGRGTPFSSARSGISMRSRRSDVARRPASASRKC